MSETKPDEKTEKAPQSAEPQNGEPRDAEPKNEEEPEAKTPQPPQLAPAPRKGVMSVELKVVYEDGFSQTMGSPDMIQIRQAGQGLLTPTQRPTLVKAVNVEAVDKALSIIDMVRADVEATRPSDAQISQAKAAIAAQAQATDRDARMGMGPQGPMGGPMMGPGQPLIPPKA